MSQISTREFNIGIGLKLRGIRDSTELSQADFAARLGVSLRAYANYERGEREMPMVLLRSLHESFGIDLVWFVSAAADARTGSGASANH